MKELYAKTLKAHMYIVGKYQAAIDLHGESHKFHSKCVQLRDHSQKRVKFCANKLAQKGHAVWSIEI